MERSSNISSHQRSLQTVFNYTNTNNNHCVHNAVFVITRVAYQLTAVLTQYLVKMKNEKT